MKKKILKLVLGSSVGMVAMGLIIIIPCLMLMDFFGANVTDGFVENNSEYADTYKSVLNQNIKTGKGYVSLERVLYFYLASDSLSMHEIYTDNLDSETKKQKTISEVCEMKKYINLPVCSDSEIESSGQINEEQLKPFNAPLNPQDTEQQTYGCRANNPDICGNNGLPNICAFSSADCICKKPSRAWKKQYNKLKD